MVNRHKLAPLPKPEMTFNLGDCFYHAKLGKVFRLINIEGLTGFFVESYRGKLVDGAAIYDWPLSEDSLAFQGITKVPRWDEIEQRKGVKNTWQ